VDSNRLVAYGVLTRSFFRRPFIEMLQVAEAERRKGYGNRLLAELETKGLRHGEIWTSTNRSNKAMRSLLRKRGFVLTGRVSRLDRGDVELFYCKKQPNPERA
jgi:GNAT superfamily N-acetyltransferase